MRKPDSTFEWHMIESDTEWECLDQPSLPESMLTMISPTQGHSSSQQFIWVVVALFLLFLGTGIWWRYTAQTTLQQQEAELRVMREQKLKAIAPDSENDIFQTLMVQGEQAVVHIVTGAKRGASGYRQTRFYRHIDAGWQPTAPTADLWGPERSLETPFFIFHFHQYDAAAVIAVTSQVEALYMALRRNVGLVVIPNAEKLIIEVSVTQRPGSLSRMHMPAVLLVPSPAVYWAPSELSDAELLLQSIALPLHAYIVEQARKQYTIGSAWQPLLNGLRLWQLWDLNLPLSGWREDVVQWLYLDLPDIHADKRVALPERYTALCAMHKLWIQSPLLINIPLVCAEGAWENHYLSPWVLQEPLLHLDQLAAPVAANEYINQSTTSAILHPGQTVALATLIDYAATTYGREHLPTLLEGLGRSSSWHTLLPAVYSVSPATFEAGWQTYLATHYHIVE